MHHKTSDTKSNYYLSLKNPFALKLQHVLVKAVKK